VVADVGSHTSKFGFSGEDTPKSTFTSVRRPRRGAGNAPAWALNRGRPADAQMLVKEGDTLHVGDEATAIPREGCPVVNSSEFSTGERRAPRWEGGGLPPLAPSR